MISTMFLLTFIAVSLPLLVSSGDVKELGSIEKKCQEKTKAKKEDLVHLHDLSHLDDTKETRCMVACVLDLYGTLDDKGAPSVGNIEPYLKVQFKVEDHDKAEQIWLDCFTTVTKENIPDHCDYLYKFVQCFIDDVRKAKIEILPFFKVVK